MQASVVLESLVMTSHAPKQCLSRLKKRSTSMRSTSSFRPARSALRRSFSYVGGFSSFLSECSGVGFALFSSVAVMAMRDSIPKRLRSSGRTQCLNGHFVW